MPQAQLKESQNSFYFTLGIGMTLFIAIFANYLGQFPFLRIMGQLVIAILIGMIWRATLGLPNRLMKGTNFSSKKILRFGIILLGMRLNIVDILHAGPRVFFLAVINIAFTLVVVYGLTRLLKVEKRVGILTAVGTAICGAAAVVAIAPQIKADDDETAIGVAIVAILGTIFTLVYTVIYPVLGLSQHGYGIFAGATLHEIAHVIAATAPVGKEAVDIAVIVKLTRVALLVPVAILIGIWGSKEKHSQGNEIRWKSIPIPWFIIGFVAMSALHSIGLFSKGFSNYVVDLAYLLMGMAMAGLGLNVDLRVIKKLGIRAFFAGLIGSILLSIFGYLLVYAFHLA